MVSLRFRKVSDKAPKHNQEIWYILTPDFYGSYEFKYGTVQYSWEEIDESGLSTGSSFMYNPNCKQPKMTKLSLAVCDDRYAHSLNPDTLWAACSQVESAIFK